MRHEFPDAWELFQRSFGLDVPHRDLQIRISRKHLPFLPYDPEVSIRRLALLFETEEHEDRGRLDPSTCPCDERTQTDCHIVELMEKCQDGDDARLVKCVAVGEPEDLYGGITDVRRQPFGRERDGREFTLRFSRGVGNVKRAFFLCGYEKIEECRCGSTDMRPRKAALGGLKAEAESKLRYNMRAISI